MSAETPGTPPTTWVPADLLAALAPLAAAREAAAREAAAREEGRAELRDAAHLVAESHAEQIRQLRAEVAAAEQRLDAVLTLHQPPAHLVPFAVERGISMVCPACGHRVPCPTARAATEAVGGAS